MSALLSSLRIATGNSPVRAARRLPAARAQTARSFRSTGLRKQQFLNANEKTFLDVIAAERTKDRVVLVDFYADWCGPCKVLSPILEDLTSEKASEPLNSGTGLPVDLVTVDVDAEADLAGKFKIGSIPTVIAFKDGKAVKTFVGATNEAGIKIFVQDL